MASLNPLEHELTYPLGDALPATGTVITLRPGLHWLRMPLPFALDHINLWLLDDEIDGVRGFTAIDCGISSEATRGAWEQLFDTVFDGKPLVRVLATHFHPDHLGLGAWLAAGGERQRWSTRLWMTHGEYAIGRLMCEKKGEAGLAAGERAAAFFQQHGLADPESLAAVAARGGGYYSRLVPAVPTEYRRISDGDEIAIGVGAERRTFRVIIGYGHAPEHVSLYDAAGKVLISGDMVLPRISTNVSVFDMEPEGNPLPRYLRSLDAYGALPADTLVLPSHGKPFIGLHQRIAQQHAHHEARLAEVLDACRSPCAASDIVPVMFKRKLDLHQTTFALGESLAHLHALWYTGALERREAAGVLRFAAPA